MVVYLLHSVATAALTSWLPLPARAPAASVSDRIKPKNNPTFILLEDILLEETHQYALGHQTIGACKNQRPENILQTLLFGGKPSPCQ